MEKLKDMLNSKGIRPSYPRLRIYKYLEDEKNHPTVDKIYRDLHMDMPTLSKTTVYNTLNLFVDSGIVKIITIEDGEARYDADTSFHGHFKCQECGEVYDFKLATGTEIGIDGFEVEQREIYYYGKCKKCLSVKH